MVRETEVVCHKSDESIFAGKITFFKAGKPAGRDMDLDDCAEDIAVAEIVAVVV